MRYHAPPLGMEADMGMHVFQSVADGQESMGASLWLDRRPQFAFVTSCNFLIVSGSAAIEERI